MWMSRRSSDVRRRWGGRVQIATAMAPRRGVPRDVLSLRDDELLTMEEVASVFRVHLNTVRRQVAQGKLPVVRFGSRVRIRVATVRGFIEGAS